MATKKRKFKGSEIEWLVYRDDEDGNEFSSIVEETPLSGRDGGYQRKALVAHHPDGKFYKFTYLYDDEHGLTLSGLCPEDEFEAIEVKLVEIPRFMSTTASMPTHRYVPVDED